MKVQVTKSADYSVAILEGRVDTTNAGELERAMSEIIEGGSNKIILDCSGLNYISSSGLSVFLLIQKKMTPLKGQFRLCSLQPGIREIFDISGFSSTFSLFSDKESAMKW